MDMSDPHGAVAEAPALPAAVGGTEGDATKHWLALVSEFGADVAGPLTAALERIDALTASGRITRADLRALREEVQQARQAGMLGQQLTILASGGLRHSPERLVLEDTVHSVLGRRADAMPEREITVDVGTHKTDVVVDATLLFSLLNSLFDWAIGHSAGRCEFRTGEGAAASYVQLECRYEPVRQTPDTGGSAEPVRPPRLNALAWRILEQTGAAMGLVLHHDDAGPNAVLTLQFSRAAPEEVPLSPLATSDEGFASENTRPLAGSQVLVISSRRDMRVQIRDALRNMGLMIDFVSSVNEAAQFSEGGPPDAVIVESIQRGERFARFREELCAKSPTVAFIEIVEQGRTFEKSGSGGEALGRVGRDAIDTALPAALIYELSKG
jgi:hypothetical protein